MRVDRRSLGRPVAGQLGTKTEETRLSRILHSAVPLHPHSSWAALQWEHLNYKVRFSNCRRYAFPPGGCAVSTVSAVSRYPPIPANDAMPGSLRLAAAPCLPSLCCVFRTLALAWPRGYFTLYLSRTSPLRLSSCQYTSSSASPAVHHTKVVRMIGQPRDLWIFEHGVLPAIGAIRQGRKGVTSPGVYSASLPGFSSVTNLGSEEAAGCQCLPL